MNKYKTPRPLYIVLAIFSVSSFYLPAANAGLVNGNKWHVNSGDTLYAIARAIYPGDRGNQRLLRRDITALNPEVFKNGANNMKVGTILFLPSYIDIKKPEANDIAPAKPKVATSLVTPPVSTAPATPVVNKPTVTNSLPDTPKKSMSVSEKMVEVEPEPAKQQDKDRVAVMSSSRSGSLAGNMILSLGYSVGGDRVISVSGGADLSTGSGAHIRFGYEGVPVRGSGYRIMVGYQYGPTWADNGKAVLRDAYLQLAYQYRAGPMIYGVGVVSHSGAKLKVETTSIVTTEYDAASGGMVYLEYVGGDNDYAYGVSYTSLEFEEKGVATPTVIEASRAELYYGWKF